MRERERAASANMRCLNSAVARMRASALEMMVVEEEVAPCGRARRAGTLRSAMLGPGGGWMGRWSLCGGRRFPVTVDVVLGAAGLS